MLSKIIFNTILFFTIALIGCGDVDAQSHDTSSTNGVDIANENKIASQSNNSKDTDWRFDIRVDEDVTYTDEFDLWDGSGGQSGFIDSRGKIVVPPIYDVVDPYDNGMAVVKKGKKEGIVDIKGNIIVPLKFDWIGNFVDGLTVAKINDERCIINTKGEIIATLNYAWTGTKFSDGMLRVEDKNGMWGFVDMNGNEVIEPKFGYVMPFSDGRAFVKSRGLWGLIDKKGEEWVVKPVWDDVNKEIEDGLRGVCYRGKWGYVDKSGTTFVIKPRFTWCGDFNDGIAVVSINEDEYGIINKKGQWVGKKIKKQKHWNSFHIHHYKNKKYLTLTISEGVDRERESKYGWIDRKGNIVIEPKFRVPYIGSPRPPCFNEGAALVFFGYGDDYGCGFIDEKGKWIIEPKLTNGSNFQEGLAAVEIDNKWWGYVDKKGEFKISPKFHGAVKFNHGLAWVSYKGRDAYIDKSGKYVWKAPKFIEPPSIVCRNFTTKCPISGTP